MIYPALLGATDETYGVMVWVSRIEGLKSQLRVIESLLPENDKYLRNQVRAAIKEADRYLADAVPNQEDE